MRMKTEPKTTKGMKRIAWTIFSAFATVTLVNAQEEETLGRLELQVRERYEARVSEAEKISELPELRDTSTRKLPVNYSTLTRSLNFTFRPEPLKPVRIAKTEVEQWPRYSADLGWGLYTSPWLRLQAVSGRNSKWQWAATGEHNSTRGGIRDLVRDNWGADKTSLGGRLKYMWRDYSLAQSLGFSTRGASYYGLPLNTPYTDTLSFPEEVNRNRVNLLDWNTSVVHTGNGESNFRRADLSYHFLNDRYNSLENRLGIITRWVLPIQKEKVLIDADMDFFRTNLDSLVKEDRSFFQVSLAPRIQSRWEDLRFSFGLRFVSNTAWSSAANEPGGSFYTWPHLNAEYDVVPGVLRAHAGFDGEVFNHSYRSLQERNLLLSPALDLRPEIRTKLNAGLDGKLSSLIGFTLNGRYIFHESMPLFYRNPEYYYLPDHGLGVVYDNISEFRLEGGLEFVLNKWDLKLNAAMMSYDTDLMAEAWYLPGFTAGAEASGWIKQKIGWEVDLNYVGNRTAFDPELEPTLRIPQSSRLTGYLDAGLGLTYRYNNNLSGFLRGYNLLNNPYDLYLGYPVQGIQFMLGASYRL